MPSAPPPPPPPPPLSTSDHAPCFHVNPTYIVGNSSSPVEAHCWTFSNGKQLVTVRMNQIQSQLVLGTKRVLTSDYGTCTANLLTFTTSHTYLSTSRVRRSRTTRKPERSECSTKHEGATRAHLDNRKMTVNFFSR